MKCKKVDSDKWELIAETESEKKFLKDVNNSIYIFIQKKRYIYIGDIRGVKSE